MNPLEREIYKLLNPTFGLKFARLQCQFEAQSQFKTQPN